MSQTVSFIGSTDQREKKENLHIQLSCDFKSCDFAEFKDIRVAWQPLVMPK